MLHGLILIPYYFLGTMCLVALITLLCRVIRLNTSGGAFVPLAVAISVGAITISLVTGWATLADFHWKGVVALMASSFVLAGLDAGLKKVLPLTCDHAPERVYSH